jgi:hypothetical protein
VLFITWYTEPIRVRFSLLPNNRSWCCTCTKQFYFRLENCWCSFSSFSSPNLFAVELLILKIGSPSPRQCGSSTAVRVLPSPRPAASLGPLHREDREPVFSSGLDLFYRDCWFAPITAHPWLTLVDFFIWKPCGGSLTLLPARAHPRHLSSTRTWSRGPTPVTWPDLSALALRAPLRPTQSCARPPTRGLMAPRLSRGPTSLRSPHAHLRVPAPVRMPDRAPLGHWLVLGAWERGYSTSPGTLPRLGFALAPGRVKSGSPLLYSSPGARWVRGLVLGACQRHLFCFAGLR